MRINQVKEILAADCLACDHRLEKEVYSACGSDLMSDVLAFGKEKVVLLTGLVSPQVIRTAEMMDIRAVVFVRGKTPTKDIIQLAEEKNIVVLTTKHLLYIACGLLFTEGLGGGELNNEASL